jgi:hypothetical protein
MHQKKQTILLTTILIALPTMLQAKSLIGDSRLDFSDLVEADIFSNNSDASGNSLVSTVEFGIEAILSDKVSASITLLTEDIGSSADVNDDVGNVANGRIVNQKALNQKT